MKPHLPEKKAKIDVVIPNDRKIPVFSLDDVMRMRTGEKGAQPQFND